MKNRLISSISPLTPINVWDVRTGEQVTDWATPVNKLLSFVKTETEELYKTGGVEAICSLPQKFKPAEHARQNNLKLLHRPTGVKALSRVEKLVQEKLVSEVTSYVNNPNPNKKPPTFYPKVNLGAVDKQMATLSVEALELTLLWKVWDREFLFEFKLPDYVTKRTINKWCLPTVQSSRRTGLPIFIFAFEETPKQRSKPRKKHSAGIDLGRVEPFTLAILNEDHRRVASYTASPGLKQASRKRDRLIVQRAETLAKLDQYKKLNYNPEKQEILQENADRLRSKIRNIGNHIAWKTAHEVTKKVSKHELNLVKLEDLSWVKGAKYGGRWNHSATSSSISHSLARESIKTVKVNPKNTSRNCHKCGSTLTNTHRSVHCASCKETFDRDYNAAMNIATKKPLYPASKRLNRDDPTTTEIVDNLTINLEAPLRKTT